MVRHILFILIFTAATTAHGQHWQQKTNYAIDVTLTDSTHSLDGAIRIQYINRSPDTLSFIWIRCWPNAYRNDRTAFSEQLIRNGRTDFYFSGISQKGYINRLEFRVDGQLARMEDHPQYIDLIKVILPTPLHPGDSTTLTTPFHVQLPDIFSHFGYHQGTYQLTQWYPRPAVYDAAGWHPDPYLDQGGTYNDFGDFDVRITLPANFIIAAPVQPEASANPTPVPPQPPPGQPQPSTTPIPTTLSYHQTNVPDFAWFASRRYHSTHDTLRLPSGRIIDLYSYYLRPTSALSRNGIKFLKDALRFHSAVLGDYPFSTATIVETRSNPAPAGAIPVTNPVETLFTTPAATRSHSLDQTYAAYPGIIAIDTRDSTDFDLDLSIARSLTDQYLSIAIGANGRRYPWMTDGIGQYYFDRYRIQKYGAPFLEYFVADTFHRSDVNTRAVLKTDQPVSTSSEEFTPDNYPIIARYKTAIWLLELQHALGAPLFDSCMHAYVQQRQFLQTTPADLKKAFAPAPINLDSAFALLDSTGPVPPSPYHQRLQFNPQLIPHPPTHANRLNASPFLGFNDYDHLMIGAVIHNFNLPPDHWQILAAPLYSPVSHQLNGLAHFNYAWYPRHSFRLIEAGINASRFSTISGTDSNGHAIFGGFYKVVPYLRLFLPRPSPASTWEGWLEWKTFLIGERGFNNYVQKSTDSLYYPVVGGYDFRYLNQLGFTIRDSRTLFPYSIDLKAQQAAAFYRINLDIHYFFNYKKSGGLDIRLFGAKFGYLGTRDPAQDLTPYEPKLTAVRGSEDYTYENYFIGRNEYNGFASQQVMMRDGDLKLRTDLFQSLQGRSDNWVAAVNLNTSLPPNLVPTWLPLHLFLDLGTYAQAWSDNPPTSHVLYVGGFELDLFKNMLRIYAPLIYSSDFRNQLKTVPGQNGFFQKISFSIDVRQYPLRKLLGYTPF